MRNIIFVCLVALSVGCYDRNLPEPSPDSGVAPMQTPGGFADNNIAPLAPVDAGSQLCQAFCYKTDEGLPESYLGQYVDPDSVQSCEPILSLTCCVLCQ